MASGYGTLYLSAVLFHISGMSATPAKRMGKLVKATLHNKI
jgi:hypothetical protein